MTLTHTHTHIRDDVKCMHTFAPFHFDFSLLRVNKRTGEATKEKKNLLTDNVCLVHTDIPSRLDFEQRWNDVVRCVILPFRVPLWRARVELQRPSDEWCFYILLISCFSIYYINPPALSLKAGCFCASFSPFISLALSRRSDSLAVAIPPFRRTAMAVADRGFCSNFFKRFFIRKCDTSSLLFYPFPDVRSSHDSQSNESHSNVARATRKWYE